MPSIDLFAPIRRAARVLGEFRARGLGTGYVPAAPVLSGTYITPQTALGLPAAYAAIKVIAQDLTSLPLHVYRKRPDGGRSIDENHPVEDLLNVEADDETGALKWRLDRQGHLQGWGNSFSEIVRDSYDGRPVALHITHPGKTIPKRDKDGRLYYELDNKKTLRPENVIHCAGLGFDGIQGYSPVTVCRQAIGAGVAAEQFAAAFFGNGSVGKGILKYPKKLKEAAVNNLRSTFNQIHQGAQSAHQLMILEEGMDYVQTLIPPNEAQYIETRQFSVVDCARIWGVPPHKLGDYSQAHLQNVEESNLHYIVTTLAFWARVEEAELNRKLLTRRDRKKWVILHDFTSLLRGNTTARTAYYQAMRNMGCFSADDILRMEGLNPIGAAKGGDKHLVQMQYQPLEKAGTLPSKTTPPAEPSAKDDQPPPVARESESNGTS